MNNDKPEQTSTGSSKWGIVMPSILIVAIAIVSIAGIRYMLVGPSSSNVANQATVIDLNDLQHPTADIDTCLSEEGVMTQRSHTIVTVNDNGQQKEVCVLLSATPVISTLQAPSSTTPDP